MNESIWKIYIYTFIRALPFKVISILGIYLVTCLASNASVVEDELLFDGLAVRISDTLVRPVYLGEPIPYLSSDIKKDSDALSATRPIRVTAFRGERENAQLQISTNTKGVSVGRIRITDPQKADGKPINGEAPEIRAYFVGDLEGIDEERNSIGPFPDVLIPINERDRIDSFGGIRLLISVISKQSSVSGIYQSELTVGFNDGRTIRFLIEVSLLDYDIPRVATINTNLFSLDVPSLSYWYRAGPDSDQMGELVNDAAEVLFQHRFSPAKIPLWFSGTSDVFQVNHLRMEDHTLELAPGDKHTTVGPLFNELGSSFEIEVRLQMPADNDGTIMQLVK